MNTDHCEVGPNGNGTNNAAADPPILPANGSPPPPVKPPKESWADCFPLCPNCGEPMRRDGEGWLCVVHQDEKKKRGCEGTATDGKWRVEFFPTIPTLNQKGRVRLNQLTLETWPDKDSAETRVTELKIHFGGSLVVPKQPTWLSPDQCRAGERFFLHNKHSFAQLEFCERLLGSLANSALKSPEELIKFLQKHKECGIPCSPTGMVKFCQAREWCGDLVPRPDFVEAVQRVLKDKTSGYGGSRPISEEHRITSISQNSYIMAYFQPNYPEPTYPDEVFSDEAILRFCTYSYDTPREGMPETEMQKWRAACAQAEKEGRPLPPQPVEEVVYKLVQDGEDQHGNVKWKKVPGTLEYPRPWPRSVTNSFLIHCRALKNAMARETLCGKPAKWTKPAGELLKKFTGTAKELAAEAVARAKERRALTPAEEQRILNASLVVEGGIGAPSVLWQGWGGGRRADVKRYVQENLSMVNGRIQIERWQTKNQSCKDVTPMLNFYLMADYLMRIGLWIDSNFERGFSTMTRIRILTRAGFWEDSWEMVLSKADTRAAEDFGYQPFEADDLLDLPGLVDLLLNHSTPGTAFIWEGFSEPEKQTLLNYRPVDKGQRGIGDIIVRRLNELMYGPLFHTDALFQGVRLRGRTADLLESKPTGPNLHYLNRLQLEDMFPDKLARRQNYPPNALRRTGMSAYYQVFESKDATTTYFSTGGSSWEEAYKTLLLKPAAKAHWQVLYGCMDKGYADDDRKQFLPAGHKLDDFQTPFVVESQAKNEVLAAEYKETVPPPVPRQPSGYQNRKKYSAEEKAKYVAEFKESGVDQKKFAEAKGLVFGVFHRWLEKAGLTRKVRTQEEIDKIVSDFNNSGMTQRDFVQKTGISQAVLSTYLKKAGQTEAHIRHSPKEIAQYVAQYRSSNMSKRDFAASIGVDVTSLRKWVREDDAARAAGKNEEPSDIKPHRKLTDQQIAEIVGGYDPSKMGLEEYANSKGVKVYTLGTWLKAAGKTKPRRSKQEVAEFIAKFQKSGMTQFAFARENNIAPETLSRWLNDQAANGE